MNKQEYLKQLEEDMIFFRENNTPTDKRARRHYGYMTVLATLVSWEIDGVVGKFVPCEPTLEMAKLANNSFDAQTDMRAAIQAAPSKLDELIGGEG